MLGPDVTGVALTWHHSAASVDRCHLQRCLPVLLAGLFGELVYQVWAMSRIRPLLSCETRAR